MHKPRLFNGALYFSLMETEIKQPLPNATAVLVLGICSIVFGCWGVGLILGIIGLVMSKPGRAMQAENPNKYLNYGQLQAGFICSIIGTVLGALGVIYWVVYIWIISTVFSSIAHHGTQV